MEAVRDADGRPLLLWAVVSGAPESSIKLLLKKFFVAEIDAAARNGSSSKITALYVAASIGRTEVVSRLLDAGASVDKAANDGVTPLYNAALL